MAIDYVAILRSAPDPQLALDNALFVAAQQSSFVGSDLVLPTALSPILTLIITRPSKVVVSLLATGTFACKLTSTAQATGFEAVYSGYSTASSFAATTVTDYVATVTSANNAMLIEARVGPALDGKPLIFTLHMFSASGAKLLAGSYMHIL